MTRYKVNILALILPLLSGCSVFSGLFTEQVLHIYNSEEIRMIYDPQFESKLFIYFGNYDNPNKDYAGLKFAYEDSSLIKLFSDGTLTVKMLFGDRQDEISNDSEWQQIAKKTVKIISHSESRYSEIPDSNKIVAELTHTKLISHVGDTKIYEFQIVFGYGTSHYCYALKDVDGEYYLKSDGIIL